MIEQLITDHLDLWSSAVRRKSSAGRGSNSKLELTGIKKLRELILELAVRGKLVPQDPNDEPASVLLERIAAEKARLVKEGKIKKPKPLPEITDDEKPFELPEGWNWGKLGTCAADIHYGYTASANYDLSEFRLLRITDIQNDFVNWDAVPGCEISKEQANGYLLCDGDILIARTGGTIGKSYLVENINVNSVFASYLIRVRRLDSLNSAFIKVFLGSNCYWSQLEKVSMGTGQPNVNGNSLKNINIPLPPLAEQYRIVAKVDELMSLCDQLEQKSEASLAAHQTLVETLLATLTESADSSELAHNWARLAQYFDSLFTTQSSIDALKQTILQLAVMGKLVPQDPNDEPASALLERIAAEKARLIKEGKIKKEKPLPTISEEEKPFALPDGWEWVRFGLVVNFMSELVRPEEFLHLDQVAPDSIEKGTGKLLFRRTVKESGVAGPNNRFYKGQVLYSKIRPSLSKALIADFDGLCSADMYPLEPLIDTLYLLNVILSEVFLEQVRVAENRIKMPKLNIDSLSNIVIPLCPLAMMGRINSRIIDIVSICDQLSVRLQASQITQLHLAEALVEGALN